MKKVFKANLPLGFKASAVACGLKKSGKLDLALLYSELPALASAQFTTNSIIAAPLIISKKHLRTAKRFQAILVNSGNANCFTGKTGLSDAQATVEFTARELGLKKNSVLINSTGIIGRRLNISKIKLAMPKLVRGLTVEGINAAKNAILTTDTFSKEVTIDLQIGKCPVKICAIAKGAGMVAPHMATMLCFILTDARIGQNVLDKALKSAVADSFNCITVDGCMSTNDTVMMLANGASGNKMILKGKDLQNFSTALNTVCLDLAKMVVCDAEGATKFIQIDVTQARNDAEAKGVALEIANSLLFKTAVFGENPNFGRVASAVGASGFKIKETQLQIKLGSLKGKTVKLSVKLLRGQGKARVFTSDLTPEYIKINAEYN